MKFRSPSHAIIWSILRRQQLSFFALVFAIPIIVLIKILLSQNLPSDIYQKILSAHPMLLFTISPFLIMIFTFAELNGAFTKNAFPRYTFTHPMSSARLATIPIFLGMMSAYLFYSAWFIFVAEHQFYFLQYLILLSCVCSAVSWLQLVSWRFNSSPYLSVTLMLALAVTIFVLIVSSWGTSDLVPIISNELAYVGLIILPISGIALAINSVARCRTNDIQRKTRYLSNVKFIGFGLPKHYSSKTQALFRYEWRVFGWIMPMAGIFMFSILVFVGLDVDSSDKIMPILFIMIGSMIYLPWFLPAEMSKSELSISADAKPGLSSFITNLPVTNFQIAMSKIKLAARSTFIYHVMLLLAVNYFVFSIEIEAIYSNPWDYMIENFGLFLTIALILALNMLVPIVTWVLGGNTLAWCLKGNKFFSGRRLVFIAFGLMTIIPIGILFFTNDPFRAFLLSYAPYFNWVVSIGILLIFIRSLNRYKKLENLGKMKVPFFAATLLFIFFAITLFSFDIAALNKGHSVLILIDLTLLGVLPFLTSPLSVAFNRAR